MGDIASEEDAGKFLLPVGAIDIPDVCPICDSCMRHVSQRYCTATGAPNKSYWYSRCRQFGKHPGGKEIKLSSQMNTIFARMKMTKKQFIYFAYFWLQDVPHSVIHRMTSISPNTITDWSNYLREVMGLYFSDAGCQLLGGPGVIVQIDESKFGKRKYNVSNCRRQFFPQQLCTNKNSREENVSRAAGCLALPST